MRIWSTPAPVFDKLNDEFCFDMDVCADSDNAKCRMFYTQSNGLTELWGGVVFLNPPYGKGLIEPWMKRAYETAKTGAATVVCLIPSRTNSPWWHDYVMKATEIRFVRKKLSFIGVGENTTPFWGNAIVVFQKWMVGSTPKVSSWEQPKKLRERKYKNVSSGVSGSTCLPAVKDAGNARELKTPPIVGDVKSAVGEPVQVGSTDSNFSHSQPTEQGKR